MPQLPLQLNEMENQNSQISFSRLLQAIEEAPEKLKRDDILSFIDRQTRYSGVFTIPEEITGLMAEVGQVFKPHSVIDINCGIGDVLKHCDYAKVRVGIDRNSYAIKLAKYLYPDIDFRTGNVIDVIVDQKFDLVISIIPFGQRIRQDGKSRPIEKLFLEKAINLLNDDGVAVCLLPINLLTAPLYEEFRKYVLDLYALDMVVTLPVGSISGTGIQACIPVIRNGKPQKNVYLAEYQKNGSKIIANFQSNTGDYQIPLDRIQNRWDRYFYDPKFDEIDTYLQGEQVKKLEEISEIIQGYFAHRGEDKEKGKYLILTPRNFRNGKIEVDRQSKYIDAIDTPNFSRAILRDGDIIVSLVHNPVLYAYKEDDPPAIVSQHVAIIRSRENKYISTYLRTSDGLNLFLSQADRKSGGAVIRRLSIRDLRNIRVPILPLADLNAISNEEIEQASQDELTELKEQLAFYKQLYEKEKLKNKQRDENSERLLLRFLKERFDSVDSALQSVSTRVDQIISLLKHTQQEIQSIKKSPRDEEEKLVRIYSKLNELSDLITEQRKTIGEYAEIVQRWLELWDILDEASQKFLSSAEFLFDEIYKIEDDDYSPFIIQYCRALENEILKKLFETYNDDLNSREKDIALFLSSDLEKNENGEPKLKSYKFALYLKSENKKYTLGEMNFIMQLIKPGGKTLSKSALLQDFRQFTLKYFDERIVEKEYLDQINRITEDFRNKAAHPYILDIQIAQNCRTIIRKCLNEFLLCYRPITTVEE
jgi:hypothetical protein